MRRVYDGAVTDGVRAQLAEFLHIPADQLTVLDRFGQSDVRRLHDITVDAVARQTRELDAALERALGFIPALLRGRARKLLFSDRGRG